MTHTKAFLIGVFVAGLIHANESDADDQFQLLGVTFGSTLTDSSKFVQIDPLTGQGAVTGVIGTNSLNSLARDKFGTFYSVKDTYPSFPNELGNRLVTIDPLSGNLTSTSILDFGGEMSNVRDLAFSSDGTLYAIEDIFATSNDVLYRIDLGNTHTVGNDVVTETTLIGFTGTRGIQSMCFSPGGILFGWDVVEKGLVTIDTATGVATDVNPSISSSSMEAIQAMTFAPDGSLYGAYHSLYQIDAVTGDLTLIGSGAYSDIRGLVVVPEPRSIELIVLGGLALLLLKMASEQGGPLNGPRKLGQHDKATAGALCERC
jgi:hypothetical protein